MEVRAHRLEIAILMMTARPEVHARESYASQTVPTTRILRVAVVNPSGIVNGRKQDAAVAIEQEKRIKTTGAGNSLFFIALLSTYRVGS